jgi:hypothetical protein
MKACVHLRQYLAEFFVERDLLQTDVVQNVTTHILHSTAFPKVVPFITLSEKI